MTALTPNENAAASLETLPMSLEALARDVRGEERIAHPVTVQRLMREVVGEVLDSKDPEGLARTLLSPVRELFRAGTDLNTDPGSLRTQRTFRVAGEYRSRLRERGLLDTAEALLEVASIRQRRRTVLVWGYPRFGRDELAFVDAVAGDGSVVYLPYADDRLFEENKETTEALRQRTWTVDREYPRTVWDVSAQVEATEYPHLEAEVRGVLTQVKELLA